ncbi:divergent AAA domain protein [Gardnerella vaginalis]|uniref:Divergent AAA domain protein n=1 Tax=Gardnerella vaginalis TaxID=2702 RepID=A0A135Z3M2_GARVA|nr:ATP-binding protein [Gardnerella vaginalis]KXI16221.1 divergent AAA domain protein [Gardnerella vaginalis]
MTIVNEQIKDAIERLRIQKTDDSNYEAKSCDVKLSVSVWETVSAFANTNGGTLLLGLDESNNFSPTKNFDINKVRDQFIEGIGDGGANGARLTYPPRYNLERVIVDDNSQILAIKIYENPADKKPCYITAKGDKGGSYKRVDDKDIRMSNDEVYEIENALRPSDIDLSIVKEATKSDLNKDLVENLIARRANSKALRGTTTEDEKLTRLNITDKQGRVRMAGLLTLGNYPQQFFPRLFIDVTAHAGTEKSSTGVQRFIDREECSGAISEMIEDAVNAVIKNLRVSTFINGVERIEESEIPREVLREAIANAVIHREYHEYFQGQPVSVDIFPDRVVVTNPGGLWGGKTLDNIDDGESKCRNAALMQLAQYAPIEANRIGAGVVEGQGSGIAFMINEMQAWSLPKPQFIPRLGSFSVILQRAKAKLHSNINYINQVNRSQITDSNKNYVDEHNGTEQTVENYTQVEHTQSESKRNPLNDDILLTLIPVDSTITTPELAELTKKSPETIRRHLRKLIAENKVKALGKVTSKQRKYAKISN